MLHIETDNDGDQIYVHLDPQGIARLREVLQFLERDSQMAEHDHLLSPAWGGADLDENIDPAKRDSDSGDNRTVHHVKLYFWPNCS